MCRPPAAVEHPKSQVKKMQDPERHDDSNEANEASADPSLSSKEPFMEEPYTGPPDKRGITAHGLESTDELREGKEFAEMIVDTIREGLLVMDLDLCVKAANESFYRMFDVSREETEERYLYELGNGQWDLPELRELLEEILPENKVFSNFEIDHEFEGLGRRVMLLNARQLDDHQMILLAIEDVTERWKSERKLDESESLYRFFVENAQEYAIFHLDAEGRIMSWNRGAKRVFGYTSDEVIGRSISIMFTEEDRADGAPERELTSAMETGRAADDRWQMRKDGTRFWASGALEALRHSEGDVRGFIKILRDNTKQKSAEEALRALNDHLEQRVEERTQTVRELASSLAVAEQAERHRVSQVLHDELQQLLYGIQLKMTAVRKDVDSGNQIPARRQLDETIRWIEKAIDTTQKLTVDLSPPVLMSEDLTDILIWLAAQMEDMHGLKVEVRSEHPQSLRDEGMRVLLYEILRELLFNVVKHADTDRATLEMEGTEHDVRIHVIDEGTGFDAQTADRMNDAGGGFGLASVRDRLSLFRGRLDIDSSPGRGSRVTLTIPKQAG